MKGKFFGIGVGPGDPELLTIKGKRILEECDVIATPKTKGDNESTALHIVSQYVRGKEILELVLPMTKDEAALKESWRQGAEEIMKQSDTILTLKLESGGEIDITAKTFNTGINNANIGSKASVIKLIKQA